MSNLVIFPCVIQDFSSIMETDLKHIWSESLSLQLASTTCYAAAKSSQVVKDKLFHLLKSQSYCPMMHKWTLFKCNFSKMLCLYKTKMSYIVMFIASWKRIWYFASAPAPLSNFRTYCDSHLSLPTLVVDLSRSIEGLNPGQSNLDFMVQFIESGDTHHWALPSLVCWGTLSTEREAEQPTNTKSLLIQHHNLGFPSDMLEQNHTSRDSLLSFHSTSCDIFSLLSVIDWFYIGRQNEIMQTWKTQNGL